MDASIILAGQGVDAVGALDRGRVAAQGQIALNQQNALAKLYSEQGPGIMSGDPNAMNALARLDPSAGLGIQGAQLGLDEQRLGMDSTRQQMSALDEATKREAEAYAKSIGAERAAQEAAELETTIKRAMMAPTPEAFDAMMTEIGRTEMIGQFENRDDLAADFLSIAEILKMSAGPDAPKPQTEAAQLKADLDANLIDRATYDAEMARRAPKGTSIVVDPKTGQMTYSEGVGVGASASPTVGQVYNPNEVASVISMIDEIAASPNLDSVVGPIEGGGGNNIDDLSTARRAYYGGDGTALVERIGQLQNNAWLSARQMLKGGGAITDYESRKAEGAVARLSRAKSEDEFRTALKDLRDAITEGEAKLRGGGGASSPPRPSEGQPAAPVAPVPQGEPTVASDADYDALPPGTVFIDPNGVKRRKP